MSVDIEIEKLNASKYWENRRMEIYRELIDKNKDWDKEDAGTLYDKAQELLEAEQEKNEEYANDNLI